MQVAERAGVTARGMLHRSGSTLVILLIALVASAAAAVGPTYNGAARTSVLQDTLRAADPAQSGVEMSYQGGIFGGQADQAESEARASLIAAVPRPDVRAGLGAPVVAVEGTAVIAGTRTPVPLVWRDGDCAHLTFVAGHCATGPRQVVVSDSALKLEGWHLGGTQKFTGWGAFTIVGVYRPPATTSAYWFDHESSYFVLEFPASVYTSSRGPTVDAMFTPRGTFAATKSEPQGAVLLDYPLSPGKVTTHTASRLGAQVDALANNPDLTAVSLAVSTSLPGLVDDVKASWTALAVPVLLASLQLLVLIWLLLYLVVTDAVEARSPEIALVKLRGYRGLRLLRFALAEPVTLLVVALPVGVLIGWAVTALLSGPVLRPGTAVPLLPSSWAAAAAATAGGVVAVAAAARRVLVRPIVEQWRRAGRKATDRSWVLDAVVLTAAVAGLVQLKVGGTFTSARQGSLGLLVPGLLGLAVAVVSSRLLPLACRALFRRTRRAGGAPGFLAVRMIARRPGGVRTTMIVATAFALATYGVAAWLNGQDNRRTVAELHTGAPVVMSVAVTESTDLSGIVARIDPSGARATVVDSYFDVTGSGNVVLGVDPARFGKVAYWRSRLADPPLPEMLSRLSPPAAPPAVVDGDALRLRLTFGAVPAHGVVVAAVVSEPHQVSSVQLLLGKVTKAGPVSLVGSLGACTGCLFRGLSLSLPPDAPVDGPPAGGALTVDGVDARSGGVWKATAAPVTRPASWRSDAGAVVTGQGGALWTYSFGGNQTVQLTYADVPYPLPALVATTGARAGATTTINGFDAQPLTIRSVQTAQALPSVSTAGVLVDRTYAERAANGYLALVSQQVWTTAAAADEVHAALSRAGIDVVSVDQAAQEVRLIDRQGPALAAELFLADSVAATLLATIAAVLGLAIAARRRRYELAALAATGVRRRSLLRALAAEQVVVLGWGALTGVVAGVVAALLALRSVPQLVPPSTFPPLVYRLPVVGLVAAVGGALLVLLVVALVSARTLMAGVRAEQLREGDL